jgi:large repetitive protein
VKGRGLTIWRRRTAAASAKLHPYRGVVAALLVAAALVSLSSLGYGGVAASTAGYGYGYGYGYEYGDAHLIVVKHVVNDDGGSATASQFTMTIGGVTATGGNSFAGSEAGTDRVVTPGNYTVTETGPSGYDATFSAGCGGSISPGQTKTCTVTNNDRPARLVVIKHVVNDNGGSATASQFTMTITGVTAEGGNSFPGAESPGTTKEVTPGSYTVGETGPAGYDASFSAGCSGTIALGETKTCTVTNNDKPAHLIVIKHVINNDSGQATASQFTLTITGVTAVGGNSFPGAESPGTTKEVTPGSFGVTETGPSGSFATFIGCTGTIALGDTKTCTVTNNDIGPRRTPGYWKNHPEAITLGLKLGNYTVATTAAALAVFDSMNCSTSKANDIVGCLAGQLLAAKLNLANGNSTCIQPTVTKADSFLSGGTVTVGGITVTGIVYTGPSGTYSLTSAQRAVAEMLKNALDKYNNGAKSCTNP